MVENRNNMWKNTNPPPDQLDRQKRMMGQPRGLWGKLLAWCIEHPNETWRSHPILRKHTAQQACSEIRQWKVVGGQERLGVTDADGSWEAEWGHAPDDNDLEHWYVWVTWVPKDKVARTRKKAQAKGKSTDRSKV